MRGCFARHVIYPLHERLIGRRTLACAAELERTQWRSPDELRALQGRKLRALLRHAVENVPFYRERLGDCRLAMADCPWEERRAGETEVLRGLPLLSKDDIRRHGDDMLWHDAPGGLHRHNTGGSTGTPLTFHFDRRRQAYDQAARIRTHRWFGVDIGNRELFLWGSPIEWTRTDRVKRFRDALFNQRLLNAFDMSPARMDEYIAAFNRFRPAALFGYPSSIALLAEHVRAGRVTLDTRRLAAVFVTGEVCHPHQRELIRQCFAVPVADGYGSREAGFLAHECQLGGMHITAENVIVEVIGPAGAPLAAGEAGEIVVTHLDAYAQPFIRYRTGDIGRLRPGRCACGRGLPLMDVVQGRATDFLYLPDGTIKHALSIIYPLREMAGIRQFRVTQEADYAVVVDVVADDAQGGISREAVALRVRPVLGEAVPLRVEFVPRIGVEGSGKYRYVVSRASRDSAISKGSADE